MSELANLREPDELINPDRLDGQTDSVHQTESMRAAALASPANSAYVQESTELSIALATLKDIPALLALYADVIEAVAGTDNDPLWTLGIHPSEEGLASAIEAGTLLVGWCEENGTRMLAAALVANDDVVEGYESVAWRAQASSNEVCVIHLFAVHPAFQHRGFARRMLDAAQDFAREQGKRVIRLDTLASNKGAQRVYDHCGFDNLGHASLTYEDTGVTDFVMYELAL